MGWLYVPGSGDLNSDCDSPSPCAACLTAASLTWRGKPLQQRRLSRVWLTVPWMRLLSGMTLTPSQGNSFVERWLSFQPASRARGTASPESGSSETIPAISGPPPGACFGKWDPSSSFWKTPQGSLFPTDSEDERRLSSGYSESWPKMGGLRSGVCFQRKKLAHPISGSECSSWPTESFGVGLWPTPNVPDGGRVMTEAEVLLKGNLDRGKRQVGLESTTRYWRPPVARDHHASGQGERTCGLAPTLQLAHQVSRWQSPRVAVGGYTRDNGDPEQERLSLEGQASLWPTPNTAPEAPNASLNRGGGAIRARETSQCLGELTATWSTPKASEPDRGDCPSPRGRKSPALVAQTVMWATPDSYPRGGAVDPGTRRPLGHSLNLQDQATHWATPAAAIGRSGEVSDRLYAENARPLQEQASRFSPPDLETSMPGDTSSPADPTSPLPLPAKKRLNTQFDEWLMGLLPGWTDVEAPLARTAFEQWETASARLVRRLLCSSYGIDCSKSSPGGDA